MDEMLFVTASNGFFRVNPQSGEIEILLDRSGAHGGFYGMAYHKSSNTVILAERTNLSEMRSVKSSTDTTLLAYHPDDGRIEKLMDVLYVGDVHQITVYGDYIFLTDTAWNRIGICDFKKRIFVGWLNIGPMRRDVHHVNSVFIDGERILIALNNMGYPADFLELKTDDVLAALDGGETVGCSAIRHGLHGITHAHDVFPVGDDVLVCNSFGGELFSWKQQRPLFSTEGAVVRPVAGGFLSILHLIKRVRSLMIPSAVTFTRENWMEPHPVRQRMHDLIYFVFRAFPSLYERGIRSADAAYGDRMWPRGLVRGQNGLWVGMSPRASREQRHLASLDGGLRLFSLPDGERLREILIPGSGQICEVVSVDISTEGERCE